MQKLSLSVLPETFAVCKLEANAKIPEWAMHEGVFSAITRTSDELSIVCPQGIVPNGIKAEKNWKALKVNGPFDFALTGILASLVQPLAEARISIFTISTFDTDYVLVKSDKLEETVKVLGGFCEIKTT